MARPSGSRSQLCRFRVTSSTHTAWGRGEEEGASAPLQRPAPSGAQYSRGSAGWGAAPGKAPARPGGPVPTRGLAPRARRPAEAGQQARGATHGSSGPAPPPACTTRGRGAPAAGTAPRRRPPASRARPWGRGRRRAAGRETAAPAPYICGWAGRGARADAGTQGPPHPRGRSPMGSAPIGHSGALEEQMVESLVVMRRPLLPHPGPPPRF